MPLPGVEALNTLGAAWAGAMLRGVVGSSAVLAVVLLVWLPFRRRISSQLAYGLFLLVLAKAALPVPVELPLPAALARLVPAPPATPAAAPGRVAAAPVPAPRREPPAPAPPRSEPWERDELASAAAAEVVVPASSVASPVVTPPANAPADRPRPAAPVARVAADRPAPSLQALAMLAWAGLTCALFARLVWAHARWARRLRNAHVLDPATLAVDYGELCARCGLRGAVPVLVTPWVASPAAWGLFRPRVLVPPGLAEALPPGQLTWVLLHELDHIRRRDAWVALFQRLVQIAYVLHPGVWVANRLIDLQREYACDDAALALAGEVPRRDCAAGFLAVIERAGARPSTPGASPALGLFGTHQFLRRRLMRILDTRRTTRRRLSIPAALALGLMAVAALPYVRAREQEQGKPAVATEPRAAAVEITAKPAANAERVIEVRVVRKEDGGPLAGATVEAQFYREGYTNRLATTDDDGRCTIPFPFADPSFLILGAMKDGFVPMDLAWDEKDLGDGAFAPRTFAMMPGTRIGLQVQDERGQPIAGAKVVPWFLGKIGGAGKERFHTSDAAATTTDAQGRWQAAVLPAEIAPKAQLLFRLSHPDFASDRMGFSRELTIEQARAGTGVLVMKTGSPIAGRVVDPEGRPVADAAVALGFSSSDDDCERTRTDADGRFRFGHVDPGERTSLNLGVEAAGFAPAARSFRVAADLPTQEFRLEPGRPLRGRVVDTAGRPIAGAVVKFDRFDVTRHWTWKSEVDADGRFVWPDGPAAGVAYFTISKPPFTRARDRQIAAGDDATITLNRALRLRGKVVDAESGEPIAAFTLIPGWGPNQPGGQVSWRRDGSAKKLTGGAYDEVGLFPDQGAMRSLRVEADGYAPDSFLGFRDNAGEIAHDFKLRKAADIRGVVQGPAGEPLAGAVVALTNRSLRPRITNGKIDEFSRDLGVTAETGPDGRFAFRPQDEPSGLVVVAREGFARRSAGELATSAEVRVEPWGRVEGICRIGERPVARQKIRLSVDATSPLSTDYEFYEYEAETDGEGRFVVERVIPGDARASTGSPQGTNRGAYAMMGSAPVEVRPGETARAEIGGQGRPVVGRLVVPGGAVLPVGLASGQGALAFKTGQAEMPRPDDFLAWDVERRRAYSLAWYKSPAARATRLVVRGNGIKIKPDGSFRAEEVLPGTYALAIDIGNDTPAARDGAKAVIRATARREVEVPEIPGGHSDEPLDLGAIELTVDIASYKALEVGQAAPEFAVQTLDGKPLSLADFRGRYVLLDFWATWCIPCLEQEPSLKAAFDAFGKDPRFAMVGLSLDDEIAAPKGYLARRNLGWTQGFLGAWSTTTVPAAYGVRGIPSIWLIGPDGKVVAKDLRGDAIKAAVARALAQP